MHIFLFIYNTDIKYDTVVSSRDSKRTAVEVLD